MPRLTVMMLAWMTVVLPISVQARPVVLELFTSQGCSSCPPADKLLAQMGDDPAVIALSLHVDYWDKLGWKDVFSSSALTDRQRTYSLLQGKNNVFTPQLMVDGQISTIGSNESAVRDAIKQAHIQQADLPLSLMPDEAKQQLAVYIVPSKNAALPAQGTIYAFYYTRKAVTAVTRGENGGSTLTNINNVTHIESVGKWLANTAFSGLIALPKTPDEAVAVIVQKDIQGRIIGAANYAPH